MAWFYSAPLAWFCSAVDSSARNYQAELTGLREAQRQGFTVVVPDYRAFWASAPDPSATASADAATADAQAHAKTPSYVWTDEDWTTFKGLAAR